MTPDHIALAYVLRGAGYTVTAPAPDPQPGQTWESATEAVTVLRIDDAGVWVLWTRHPLIDRPMECCSVMSVFKRWVRDSGAVVV